MLKKLRYILVHVPVYFHSLVDMSTNLNVRFFGYIANIILMVALCVGLYTRWSYTEDMAILIIAFLGLFIFAISCAMVYYFSYEAIGFCLSRLWLGCLLGIVAFTEQVRMSREVSEEVMDILLLTSLGVRCFWNVLERCMHWTPPQATLVTSYEALELLGMCIASIVVGQQFLGISFLVGALAFSIAAIRLKSFLGLLNLLGLCIICAVFYFPRMLQVTVNPFALCCFVGRLVFEPIIDCYFSGLTTLERWQPFLSKPSFMCRLVIVGMVILEVTFFALCAKQIPHHKEWFIVVPIFGAFSIIWWCYHLVFIITTWQLVNKISDCNQTYRSLSEESRNMTQIMANKGMRHFSLIAQRLVIITLFSTIILGTICWTVKTGLTLGLWFMVIPVEAVVMGLLWEMGHVLGGTCIGYALVAPATYNSHGSTTTVMPTSAMQEVSSRATHILNVIQRFFAFHLIETYGCDYSSSGLTGESVENKLKAFFKRQTSDGPRYDTYLVYYSGHVHENGDWALAGESTLKLVSLIEWWCETDENSGSRLVLVVDADHSHRWVGPVRRLQDEYVAIQTCRIIRPYDPEEGPKVNIGDFTSEWMTYNCAPDPDINWMDSERQVKAVYGTSKCWSDFMFHMPTDQDIAQHWDANFPKITRPLIKVTNFPRFGSLCCCCDCVIKCLRRKRMMWLPPHELDTGHGFKLVRS